MEQRMPHVPTEPCYKCTVTGEYYAITPNGKIAKQYIIEAYLDRLTVYDEKAKRDYPDALGLIVRYFLDPALAEKYEDYTEFRTHNIVDVKALNGADANLPVDYLNRHQLLEVIKKEKMRPIEPDLYPEIDTLRQAIKDYRANPDGFEQSQQKHIQDRKLKDAKDRDMMARLNPVMTGNIEDEL